MFVVVLKHTRVLRMIFKIPLGHIYEMDGPVLVKMWSCMKTLCSVLVVRTPVGCSVYFHLFLLCAWGRQKHWQQSRYFLCKFSYLYAMLYWTKQADAYQRACMLTEDEACVSFLLVVTATSCPYFIVDASFASTEWIFLGSLQQPGKWCPYVRCLENAWGGWVTGSHKGKKQHF